MTSPYVDAPPRTQPWRLVLVALACVLSPLPAAVAGWIGLIIWSGCFIECDPGSGDHLAGGGLFLLAAGLLLLGPALAWVLLRSGRAVLAAVGGVFGILLLSGLILGAA